MSQGVPQRLRALVSPPPSTGGAGAARREGVLWLWRAHNAVNARLLAEGANSPRAAGKAQRPVSEECQTCRGHPTAAAAAAPAPPQSGTAVWDVAVVLRWLALRFCGEGAGGGKGGEGAGGCVPFETSSAHSNLNSAQANNPAEFQVPREASEPLDQAAGSARGASRVQAESAVQRLALVLPCAALALAALVVLVTRGRMFRRGPVAHGARWHFGLPAQAGYASAGNSPAEKAV
mmetsp:Transcript_41513/g.97564  ORF Transcript_41513/g.97564 Transcript_41513/m.97564 type:complete len:234 (+) Transcript_41513:1500-2201(+)